MVEKMRSEAELVEPQTVAVVTEDPAVSGWQDVCRQLESTLRGAEYAALNYKNTAKYQLDEMQAAIANSSTSVQEKSLEKFQNTSAEYIGLLDEIIESLQQAEQVRYRLAGWQFSPSGVGE